jgi:NAD(P)-dependent dehydrogenase (short-subunit alcohol dehydrogenase family)
MNTKFSERVVIISGATGALGQEAARQFSFQGARLALLSSSGEKLEQMAQTLGLGEEQTLLLAGDLRQAQEAHNAVQAILARYGHVDILLHLVGGWTGGKSIIEFDSVETSQMLDQHLWTTYHLVKALTPHLVASGWGRIIAISSPLATHPVAKMSPYIIAKAAQEALLLSLAQEVKGSGVTANLLQVRTIDVKGEKVQNPTPENATWSTLPEIMTAIMYLCSEEAGAVNGARIPLYG